MPRSIYGSMHFELPRPSVSFLAGGQSTCELSRSVCDWHPSEQFRGLRDAGVFLPFEQIVSRNGHRIYRVRGSLEELANVSMKIGVEIIQDKYPDEPSVGGSYRNMFVVFR